jgi:integrase
MASVRKHPRSPYWHACFALPDGRYTQRSTGTADKRDAQRIAIKFEDASREAARGRLIESRARKTIADIFSLANSNKLPSQTVNAFFDGWLKRKELEASDGTFEKYSGVVNQFKESLGGKVERDISSITAADVATFRDSLAQKLSTGTVNIALKIIRAAFAQARKDGLIDVNEAERVSTLKRRDSFERRPFTLDELKRIYEAADEEWKGMIRFGLYTGQRLGDIASITRRKLDLQRAELNLSTHKTARRQILPLAPPLLRHLQSLHLADDPDAPVFPRAFATIQRTGGRVSQLSNQFREILVKVRLAEPRTHKAADGRKNGRTAKREMEALSFHSLRHTATSLLKAAGVSDAVAEEFIGHDSAAISQQYTHIPTEALQKAAETLPEIPI